jgi:hypothetical protein
MHGFTAKLAAVITVVTGFFITGDMQWVVDRANLWAGGTAPDVSPSPSTADASSSVPQPTPMPAAAATAPLPPLATDGVRLPRLEYARVDVATLYPGDRILARTATELVAYDLIDPSTGEAVEHRHTLLARDIAAAASTALPRRVLLPTALSAGTIVAVMPVGHTVAVQAPLQEAIEALGVERPMN